MPNVHTPERLEGESREQYRIRQRTSRFSANLGRNAETGEQVHLKGLGDNHKEPSQRQQMRDNARKNGRGPKGVFGAGIVASAAKKLRDSKAHQAKHPLRDEHGAFTLVGNDKRHGMRKWLGGISAQRGY